MPRLRPVSLRMRGVALLPLALLVVSCSQGPVDIATPDLDATDASVCQTFVADLPGTLDDEKPVEITPSDAPGTAYGDPAITVSCGAGLPSDFFPGSPCEHADGVDWYVPSDAYNDQDADVTLTTIGYRPIVAVHVPHDYRPDGVAAIFTELAPVIKKDLTRQTRCR